LFAEGCQQNDPLIDGEPIRDSASCRTKREPQLEQANTERTRIRHPSSGTIEGESFDNDENPIPFALTQRADLLGNFGV
jgi:hypothetical protein